MKNKKVIITFIFAIIMLFLFSIKSEASLKLNELNFDVQLNDNGSMNVIETWDIKISDTNTLFKTFKKDSSKYIGIENVTVKEITSSMNKNFRKISQEMYHVTKDHYYALTNSKGLFEIAWGVGLDNSSATRKYQISYTVTGALAKYNDYAELYWQFVGNDFEIDANKITGTILLPGNAESKDDIKVWGHTKFLNGEIYATDNNKIEFKVDNYRHGNFVEVRSLFPHYLLGNSSRIYNKEILNSVIAEETKWANNANAKRNLKIGVFLALCVAIVIFIFFIILNIIKNIKKLLGLEKKFKPSTDLEYFRDLPYDGATPSEALFMISSGLSHSFSSSFAANILDLCLKKHLTLEAIQDGKVLKSNVVKISLTNLSKEDLKNDQQLVIDFLGKVANNNELTTKDITKYLRKHPSAINKLDAELERNIRKVEIDSKNYIKENEKVRNKHAGMGMTYLFIVFFIVVSLSAVEMSLSPIVWGTFGLLIALLILNACILFKISSKVNLFTQKGVDEIQQWKAFKKYMEDFSLLKDKDIPSLVVWEKYLVFATAFGISSEVLKQLKVIYPELSDMNSALYSYSYIHLVNSFDIGSCISSSVYSAVPSSGSGSGGGFSGGGGGGRWTEVAAVADKYRT
ncbi:MAG: DUF2207 domain-containing protein [Clostridia bacterium]|nr:DUF2207 domain-containing protein [Clostridia bacterium]